MTTHIHVDRLAIRVLDRGIITLYEYTLYKLCFELLAMPNSSVAFELSYLSNSSYPPLPCRSLLCDILCRYLVRKAICLQGRCVCRLPLVSGSRHGTSEHCGRRPEDMERSSANREFFSQKQSSDDVEFSIWRRQRGKPLEAVGSLLASSSLYPLLVLLLLGRLQ